MEVRRKETYHENHLSSDFDMSQAIEPEKYELVSLPRTNTNNSVFWGT
jgi:hypothetical protein